VSGEFRVIAVPLVCRPARRFAVTPTVRMGGAKVPMTRTVAGLAMLGSLLFLCGVGVAEQAVDGRASGNKPRGTRIAAQPPYTPVASVKDIMETLLEPATEVIFDAVSVLPDGSVEKGPPNDAAWAEVRMSALVMSEGGNLLMMAGRRISSLPALTRSPTHMTGLESDELMPQLATRVSKTRRTWIKLAEALITAGSATLQAVDARDGVALLRADDAIDRACEACHHEYWYP
jgi:hypothetical protein